MHTFKRLLAFAKPYNIYWPKYLFYTVLGLLFGIINFILIIPLLNVIFDQNNLQAVQAVPDFHLSVGYFKDAFYYYLTQYKLAHGSMGALVFVCIIIIIASLFANLFKYLAQRVLVAMRTNVMRNIRQALFEKVIRLHVGYFQKQRKGDLMSSLSNDVSEVQGSVVSSFQVVFKDPIYIVGNLAVLFYMSYQLTVFTLIALPVSGFLIGRLSRKLRHKATEAQALQGNIMSMIEESISGIRIIKAFNAQNYITDKFSRLNMSHRRASKTVANRQELATPLSEFLGIAIAVIMLMGGGVMILSGESSLTVPEFVTYLAFYYQILVPAKEITKAYANIQKGLASGQRIFSILDTPVALEKRPNAKPLNEFRNEIRFKDVCFRYENGTQVIKQANLTIPKGKMYAIVGHSGAGKSTLADLLPRFYDIESGRIEIDGIDIRDYQPKDLFNVMGIVTQEAILFNDSVFNNIAFGLKDVTLEQVRDAARIANADEFISKMDEGYSTNIGDRGSRLSGGQRQRIAIARAVLKNPPILILDEATSALDTESEKLVQDALFKLMRNRTSIVIAHRLSTIKDADKIVVMHEGKIVEMGSHDELISNTDGVYHKLCSLQKFKQ